MSAMPLQASTKEANLHPDHLQKINEAIYKRNAELATKNKTLTLLHTLYEISVREMNTNALCYQFATSIVDILHLPFVAILTKDTGIQNLFPQAAVTPLFPDENLFSGRTRRVHFPKEHPCRTIFRDGKTMRRNRSFHTITKPFLSPEYRKAIQDGLHTKVTIVLPLKVENKALGVLVLALNRSYKQLSVFEQQSIISLVDVISVALQKNALYEDLEKANRRLVEIDQQKTEFLSIASHQLRTPLSVIKGYIELIEDGAYGKKPEPKLLEVLENMDESNERLINLVNSFLDISRLEQGRTKYTFADYNMIHVVTSVIDELTKRADKQGIGLEWIPKTDELEVYMDEERIRHVVFNFVDNAIKYSEEGTVRVFVKKEKRGVSVRVKDEGIGFDEKKETGFFNKFSRGKNVQGRNVNGTGLGIYVCRKFTEAHGGHVWSTSPGPGKGSEFGFWIPLHKTAVHIKSEKDGQSKKQRVVNQYQQLD